MIRLKVNGVEKTFAGNTGMPLLWYLRDVADLPGTKFGCGMALCGACTVHLDGKAVRSCSVAMQEVNGKSVTTIEGISSRGLHPVQKAWLEIEVPQCGYCQPGQIMQAIALLNENQNPSDRTSTAPWKAISAAVEPISAFGRQSIRLQRRWHERYP